MRVAYFSLVSLVLVLVASGLAPASSMTGESAPWLRVDTGGENAVVLEFTKGEELLSTVLVREGGLASIRLSDHAEAVGFVVEAIAERGDAARLGVYRVADQYAARPPRSSEWIEDVELTKGTAAVSPGTTAAYAGDATFALRLVDTILVTR